MPTKNKRSKHKRTKKRSQKMKMQRGGMRMRGGGIFSFFNSNLKPKNLVDKKTPADIFRMKQPILIEDDFFEKYKDELDTLAIPTEIREALQMMMDLKNKETVFNKCYAGKGVGPKVHFKTPMPVPAPAAPAEQEEQAPPAAQAPAAQAPAAQQTKAPQAPAKDEDEDEDEEEEKKSVMQGGSRRSQKSRKSRKSKKTKKSRKGAKRS